jgi:hypothetical protein
VRLKTRKRNIVVPHDPQSFADAVIDVIADAQESDDIVQTLAAANKVLDLAELDFNRYGDVLFEVAFAGARLASGGSTATEGKKLPFNVRPARPLARLRVAARRTRTRTRAAACAPPQRRAAASLTRAAPCPPRPSQILAAPADRAAIDPYVKWFQSMIRRRPFLVKFLEDTLIKLILSLEFYDEAGRKKIAMAMARCFSLKVGVLPERVLPAALEDRLVARGTVATFITDFFADYLATDGVEALVELLRKARLHERLLEFFPQQRRDWAQFEEHFVAAGLPELVEYNKKKLYDAHCQELRQLVKEGAGGTGEEPLTATALGAVIKAKKDECGLADPEVVKSVYLGLVDSVLDASSGRNLQQTQYAVLKALKHYHKALAAFATTGRLEAALMNTIQVTCYEDSRLLKIFADIVKVLYDVDVVGEDTIKFFYAKGSSAKGRNVFLKDIEPLVKWLDEAESEEEE